MKKKILFVIPSLEAGGGEKSLVNLLNTIDLQKYQIDLLLLNPTGIFLKLIPKQVAIISLDNDYTTFTKNVFQSVINFLKQGKLKLAFNRIIYTLKNYFIKNKGISEQHSWNNLRDSIPKIETNYDVAVGFLEKSSIYFIVDCINAKNKIGFIHNDYNQLNLDANFDLNYFKKLTTIATVSEQCKVVLQEKFPSEKDKVKVIYNIVSPTLISKMASESIDFPSDKTTLLSIGRLHPQKGFDIAIEAASILFKKGIDFTWYIIGEGTERNLLEKLIFENHLKKNFILLGIKENPYPYIKLATLFVQPSRYEGKSIALDEAKILHKPIVVTNFSTAKDQIENLKNGLISGMNSEDLALTLQNLILNKKLQKELSLHLSKEQLDSESEITKLYQLFDNEI